MRTSDQVERIAEIIATTRFGYLDERGLQEGIAAALSAQGIETTREVRLSLRERIDLLAGTIGIEVKVAGSVANVRRQLNRYATIPLCLQAVILVSTRAPHRQLNGVKLSGLPVRVVTPAWL